MKSVSTRDFQLKASEYLEELPIILTRYNVPIAKIIPMGEESVNRSDDSVNTSKMETSKKNILGELGNGPLEF